MILLVFFVFLGYPTLLVSYHSISSVLPGSWVSTRLTSQLLRATQSSPTTSSNQLPYTPTPPETSQSQYRAPMEEIIRRRNFAIISHPDAGKTTLTEKLLLFGGAIQDAGAVKARADQRKATSDWMEIEKQRGISVTSTVLSFQYEHSQRKYHLNLLDTPGHQDFSEDTYRTLAAADNCVMLVDAAKGIEDRTRKLFEVCKMRKLPIFTFANKLDRPSLSPIDLIDQVIPSISYSFSTKYFNRCLSGLRLRRNSVLKFVL